MAVAGVGSLLARITNHAQGLATPAPYGIEVTTILSATVDEPDRFARRITHLRSNLGAYTGAFARATPCTSPESSSTSTTAITPGFLTHILGRSVPAWLIGTGQRSPVRLQPVSANSRPDATAAS